MLRWLATISPVLVLLLGAVPAGALAWFGHSVKFNLFDRPAIERAATDRANDAATIRIMDAANRAEEAARSRVERANAEAFAFYRRALELSQESAAAAQQQLETEIARYETELALEGRACPLDQRTLDWLQQF